MNTKSGFQFNDGGRAAAGFKGPARDCVVRAIAIATGKSYATVYAEINALDCKTSNSRTGVAKKTTRKYLTSSGWQWTPTMAIGSGCTIHLTSAELPAGRLIVSVSRHLVAVVDGVIHDTYDSSRGGRRCVYGFYRRLD